MGNRGRGHFWSTSRERNLYRWERPMSQRRNPAGSDQPYEDTQGNCAKVKEGVEPREHTARRGSQINVQNKVINGSRDSQTNQTNSAENASVKNDNWHGQRGVNNSSFVNKCNFLKTRDVQARKYSENSEGDDEIRVYLGENTTFRPTNVTPTNPVTIDLEVLKRHIDKMNRELKRIEEDCANMLSREKQMPVNNVLTTTKDTRNMAEEDAKEPRENCNVDADDSAGRTETDSVHSKPLNDDEWDDDCSGKTAVCTEITSEDAGGGSVTGNDNNANESVSGNADDDIHGENNSDESQLSDDDDGASDNEHRVEDVVKDSAEDRNVGKADKKKEELVTKKEERVISCWCGYEYCSEDEEKDEGVYFEEKEMTLLNTNDNVMRQSKSIVVDCEDYSWRIPIHIYPSLSSGRELKYWQYRDSEHDDQGSTVIWVQGMSRPIEEYHFDNPSFIIFFGKEGLAKLKKNFDQIFHLVIIAEDLWTIAEIVKSIFASVHVFLVRGMLLNSNEDDYTVEQRRLAFPFELWSVPISLDYNAIYSVATILSNSHPLPRDEEEILNVENSEGLSKQGTPLPLKRRFSWGSDYSSSTRDWSPPPQKRSRGEENCDLLAILNDSAQREFYHGFIQYLRDGTACGRRYFLDTYIYVLGESFNVKIEDERGGGKTKVFFPTKEDVMWACPSKVIFVASDVRLLEHMLAHFQTIREYCTVLLEALLISREHFTRETLKNVDCPLTLVNGLLNANTLAIGVDQIRKWMPYLRIDKLLEERFKNGTPGGAASNEHQSTPIRASSRSGDEDEEEGAAAEEDEEEELVEEEVSDSDEEDDIEESDYNDSE